MELNKYEHALSAALPHADCGSGLAITTHRIKFRRARKIAATATATATATAAATELSAAYFAARLRIGLFAALRLLFVRAAADLHFICDGCSPSDPTPAKQQPCC